MSFPKHLSKPYLPMDSNFAPFVPATTVPLLTYDFLNEFSPNDSPFSRTIGSLFLIIILTDPSAII
jgi:hypothetical protein